MILGDGITPPLALNLAGRAPDVVVARRGGSRATMAGASCHDLSDAVPTVNRQDRLQHILAGRGVVRVVRVVGIDACVTGTMIQPESYGGDAAKQVDVESS